MYVIGPFLRSKRTLRWRWPTSADNSEEAHQRHSPSETPLFFLEPCYKLGDTGEDANAAPWFGSTPLRKQK